MARLDTGWHDNPKVVGLPWEGIALHAWSISYCDAARSDGFIPDGAWWSKPGSDVGVSALVGAGLWQRGAGGYHLHDFDKYNRTRAQIEIAQAEDRLRKARNLNGIPPESGRNPSRARADTLGRPGPGNNSLGDTGRQAGRLSPETVPESGDYPGARAREDDPLGILDRPSIGRRFDRGDGQPGKPASPSKNSRKKTTEHERAVR